MLMAFFVVFAIVGLQLLSGIAKRNCFSIETGLIQIDGGSSVLCGGRSVCDDGYFCGKSN